VARSYAAMDCQLILWLNNRTSRGHTDKVLDQTRMSSIAMAVSCCHGNFVPGRSSGGSNITDHKGNLLAEIWDKEGVIYADLDTGNILADRQNNLIFQGRRPELYL